MRDEIRDAVVVEVRSRVLAACLRQAELPDGLPLELLINDTLYHETRRLDVHPGAPNRASDAAFWERIRTRLARAGEQELRRLLEQIIDRYVHEILGHFSPVVYGLSTRIMPRTLPMLLNAMSPRRMAERGVPELADTVRIQGEVDALRRCQSQGTVILLPTHASNLDSVVVGWTLYALGLPPFTYGAGLNLFRNPLISFFLRNLGAYRVDRTKTAPLYKDVLKEYATVTLEMGQSQLFFPGGGRSRSGGVEQKLKLGLLSTGLRAYINNLSRGRRRPRIFLVPCNLNYNLVLEAESLVEEYLKVVGRARYIITDDESYHPREVFRFLRELLTLDSRIVMTVGRPLDPFGNVVDDEGLSRDRRGRPVDTSRYVLDDSGRPVPQPQRDRVYTREAGAAIAEAFRRDNVVLATNLVAFTFFEHVRASHPDMDLYRLLRTAGDGSGVEMAVLCERIQHVVDDARRLAEDGELRLSEAVEHGTPPELVGLALRHFHTFHHEPVLTRRGDRIFPGDMKLLYYYRNRLDGYGLERVVEGGDRILEAA